MREHQPKAFGALSGRYGLAGKGGDMTIEDLIGQTLGRGPVKMQPREDLFAAGQKEPVLVKFFRTQR